MAQTRAPISWGRIPVGQEATYLGSVRHALRLKDVRIALKIASSIHQRANEAGRGGYLRLLDFVLHLDLVILDLVIDLAEEFVGQAIAVVDAPVVLEKLLFGHAPRFDILTVSVSVEHDD